MTIITIILSLILLGTIVKQLDIAPTKNEHLFRSRVIAVEQAHNIDTLKQKVIADMQGADAFRQREQSLLRTQIYLLSGIILLQLLGFLRIRR